MEVGDGSGNLSANKKVSSHCKSCKDNNKKVSYHKSLITTSE